jgi:hypothetical protein
LDIRPAALTHVVGKPARATLRQSAVDSAGERQPACVWEYTSPGHSSHAFHLPLPHFSAARAA